MRLVSGAFAVVLTLLFTHDASAYARVQHRGSFGAFSNEVASAARRGDMRAMRKLVDREFTVGEELGRDSSLSILAHDASARHVLAITADRGACYRTGPKLVQCELPDAGPNLDHTKLRTSIAIFERGRRGWRLNAFYA